MKEYTVLGVKGGRYTSPKKFGAINISGQIHINNFEGAGAEYKEREDSLLSICNSVGHIVFTGTVAELVIVLSRARLPPRGQK